MKVDEALEALSNMGNPVKANASKAYHKIERPYLGVPLPELNDLMKSWRQILDIKQRYNLADELWKTNIFEARIAASKLITQARIAEDDTIWNLICAWADDFDSWAIADYVATAGQKRLIAHPERLKKLESWVVHDNMWHRRAVFVFSLPWAKMNHPKPHDTKIRSQVLDWAAQLKHDKNWFIQKAIAWWVRDLSRHAPTLSQDWLEKHGHDLKPFAQKEAAKYMNKL